eukprot:COSAG06_NODE_33173_length_494_cov_0.764557_1_plen_121_part_10
MKDRQIASVRADLDALVASSTDERNGLDQQLNDLVRELESRATGLAAMQTKLQVSQSTAEEMSHKIVSLECELSNVKREMQYEYTAMQGSLNDQLSVKRTELATKEADAAGLRTEIEAMTN